MSRMTGIHHVQITVPVGAEATAREFYLDWLGMPEMEKPDALRPQGFWMQIGEQQVHLQFEDGIDRRATRAHIAYCVDDVEAYRNRLSAHGVHVETPPVWPDHPRIQFRDPFGNYIELIQFGNSP